MDDITKSVVFGVLSAIVTQAITLLIYLRTAKIQRGQRLHKEYKNEYMEIYKLAREIDLALGDFYSSTRQETSYQRVFAALAYELLRAPSIIYIERLDWRRHDAVFYLPPDVAKRCISIRSKLFQGLSKTALTYHIIVKQYRDSRLLRSSVVDLEDLENYSKRGRPWKKIHVFGRRQLIDSSPFMSRKNVNSVRKDLRYVLNFFQKSFTT
jgi:hypothetical protein